ncbi:MAG: agmatinase [Planctomycetaceae bacterium]|nr:agmatinase [Planctomycetaceae bacterium]
MPQTISLIGIPWDEQSSFAKGCAAGPNAIRRALHCESSNTFCEAGFDIASHPLIQDTGDLVLGSGEAARLTIEQAVRDALQARHKVLALGGDHAVTWPILRAYAEFYPKLNVLHLDAHPDLYDELDGNRYSHACPFARALEEGLITRLVQVGIRTMNRHQQNQAQRFGVEIIPMSQLDSGVPTSFDGPVYLSLDLDVLDPAFAPGVSHHEPGGMTTRELISIIQKLGPHLVGADIVELNPTKDLQAVTAMTAAKLVKEVLARLLINESH